MGQNPRGPNLIIFGTGSQPSYNYCKNSKLSLFSGDLWLPQAKQTHTHTHTHPREHKPTFIISFTHTHPPEHTPAFIISIIHTHIIK